MMRVSPYSAHWNKRFISAEILAIFNDAKQGAMSSDRPRVISSARVAVDLKAADLLADCLRNKSYALRLVAWETVESVDGMLLRKAVSLILRDDAVWDPAVDPGQKTAWEEFLTVVFKTCRTWVEESGNRVDSLGLGTPEARRDLAGKIFGKTRAPTAVPAPMP